MSFRTYNALWTGTQDELGGVLERDQELQGTFNQDQRNDVVYRMRRVYAQYIQAARKLDTCHDLILHPQKRKLIRKLLDNTLGRIVEMKHEMAGLDLSDIQHMDDVMAELNLTPKDMLVPVPKYVRRERLELINQRNDFIDECLRRAGLESVEEDPGSALSVTEAIAIIQRHERARQGRAAADSRREMIARQERERSRGKQQLSLEGAVVRLQSYTRGMLARTQVREMRHQEELFLGLRPDPSLNRTWDAKLAAARDIRYKLQNERSKEMEAVTDRMRTKVVYEDGTTLMANMEDKIREWIFVKKHETGKFPDIPDEEEGGSSAILGQVRQEEEEQQEAQMLDRKGKSSKAAKNEESEREKAREKDKQRKKKEDEDRVICLKPSVFVDDIRGSCDKYQDVWEPRDVECNPKEHPEEDMVEAEQRAIVEYEIRRQVEYLMRQELQKLKEDVEGEKKGSKKKKRMKKGGKKGRKRKEKDLTPDRTTESLFEEMVLNGIIKKIPDVKLDDIHGDINLVGTETVELTKFPYPAMGDIKNILTEYVILPLGVEAVHDAAPLVKSVLIGGPRSCGKSVLVQAVAHESGATLMDLTATNIVGRYPGKSGLNMLMHLVSKVGRLLQPTVIVIDVADKMFLKKVAKTDKSDPRRLKGDAKILEEYWC
ncbi:unnamed protein product [Meganyctiphanes norvegica]|uniref:ATPase AAA-type core domain-containing protein n=1 Tax=Meganyctiphanes norvegica TaxID=48144 RepID=A0AAV2R581_MEGNR